MNEEFDQLMTFDDSTTETATSTTVDRGSSGFVTEGQMADVTNAFRYAAVSLDEPADRPTIAETSGRAVVDETLEPISEREEATYEEMTEAVVESNHSVYNPHTEKKTISVMNVLTLLKQGYTRTASTKGYDATIGCIQGYFDLTDEQVKFLFADPRLKHSRTSFAKRAEKTLVITD